MACGGGGEEEDEWQEVKSTKKQHVNHPIFKKLCIASGEVNSLTKGQIQARLKTEGLSSRYTILNVTCTSKLNNLNPMSMVVSFLWLFY